MYCLAWPSFTCRPDSERQGQARAGNPPTLDHRRLRQSHLGCRSTASGPASPAPRVSASRSPTTAPAPAATPRSPHQHALDVAGDGLQSGLDGVVERVPAEKQPGSSGTEARSSCSGPCEMTTANRIVGLLVGYVGGRSGPGLYFSKQSRARRLVHDKTSSHLVV